MDVIQQAFLFYMEYMYLVTYARNLDRIFLTSPTEALLVSKV